MNVSLVHNYYQQPGGEDAVFAAEKALLERAGHDVKVYTCHNDEIVAYSALEKCLLAKRAVWASTVYRELVSFLRKAEPAVVHFHNTFPLISPSAYYACREVGVPIVQTLHNYRYLCLAATLFRDGHVCEDCVGKTLPWPGLLHGCYRDSRAQSAVVVAMLSLHQWLKTWHNQVDVYITLTEFARQKFVEGGVPEEKIIVKPNFLHPDPGVREGEGKYVLFVGRLAAEKGLQTLLQAWRCLKDIPLRIVGDGPLADELKIFVRSHSVRVEMLGRRSHEEVIALMKAARFIVFPSEWYEGFPLTIVEAFACGLPVVASRLGAMADIVDDGRTGFHFAPRDFESLAEKVVWLWDRPQYSKEIGLQARQEYEAKYTAKQNYEMLMNVYAQAVERMKARDEEHAFVDPQTFLSES